MTAPAQCPECEAILEDLRAAAGVPTREQMLASREITLPLIVSCSHETLEELLEKHPYLSQGDGSVQSPRYLQPEFKAVYRRLLDHRARTGHWPLLFR